MSVMSHIPFVHWRLTLREGRGGVEAVEGVEEGLDVEGFEGSGFGQC
jgi:hypothetical protein